MGGRRRALFRAKWRRYRSLPLCFIVCQPGAGLEFLPRAAIAALGRPHPTRPGAPATCLTIRIALFPKGRRRGARRLRPPSPIQPVSRCDRWMLKRQVVADAFRLAHSQLSLAGNPGLGSGLAQQKVRAANMQFWRDSRMGPLYDVWVSGM